MYDSMGPVRLCDIVELSSMRNEWRLVRQSLLKAYCSSSFHKENRHECTENSKRETGFGSG